MDKGHAAEPAPEPKNGAGMTVWIHIGGIKTGTTTLQRFLSGNRKILRQQGFLYPGTRHLHGGIAAELGSRPGDNTGIQPQLPGLLEEMKRSSCPACIISAGDLAGDGGAAALREIIPKTFTVKIIYYVRRQDYMIESWYNHVIRTPFYQCTRKLDNTLIMENYHLFDHDTVIRPWAAMFGRENIVIRVYEKGQMKGDIIQDFSAAIGLAPDTRFVAPAVRYNRTFSPDHIEFMRQCKIQNKDDYWMHAFLYKEFRDSRLSGQTKQGHVLSPSMRREILEQYEESNRRVAQDYLGRGGSPFYDPWPDPDEAWEPYRGLTPEALVPIVTELIYNQAQREQAGQPLQTFLGIVNNMLKKVLVRLPQVSHAIDPCEPAGAAAIPGAELWQAEGDLPKARESRSV
ncbi:MAG: hypothetical protein EHM53_11755, partial [Methanoregulaceae archaeon]